jgi:hypothetical protein
VAEDKRAGRRKKVATNHRCIPITMATLQSVISHLLRMLVGCVAVRAEAAPRSLARVLLVLLQRTYLPVQYRICTWKQNNGQKRLIEEGRERQLIIAYLGTQVGR